MAGDGTHGLDIYDGSEDNAINWFRMAVLNVRNLPDQVYASLRRRAARHGRSMEAEARAILTEACRGESEAQPAEALQAWVLRLYGGQPPASAVAELIAERRREASRE